MHKEWLGFVVKEQDKTGRTRIISARLATYAGAQELLALAQKQNPTGKFFIVEQVKDVA